MEFRTDLKNFTLVARLKGNSKTGKGLMISILPKTGLDIDTVRKNGSAACGDCPHAKAMDGRKHGSCYVYKRVAGGQGAIGGLNNTFHRAEKVTLAKFTNQVTVLAELIGFIRVGEFGDPAVDKQTAEIIADILKGIDSEIVRAAYTHQWRKKKADSLKGLVMASVETAEEERKAQRRAGRHLEL